MPYSDRASQAGPARRCASGGAGGVYELRTKAWLAQAVSATSSSGMCAHVVGAAHLELAVSDGLASKWLPRGAM